MLKGLLEYGEDWEKELTRAIIIYNTTYHDTIRTTPSEKLMVESHPKVINAILPGWKNTVWKKGDPAFLLSSKNFSETILEINFQCLCEKLQSSLREVFLSCSEI